MFYILGGPAGSRIRNFAIYNRWGQLVFQVHNAAPNDPAFGWNGYYKETPAPAGAYVYIINIDPGDGTTQQFQGMVLLVR